MTNLDEDNSNRQVDWSEFVYLTEEQSRLLIEQKLERAKIYSDAWKKQEVLEPQSR